MILLELPSRELVIVLACLVGALIAGSLVRLVAARYADENTRANRFASLRTWWVLTFILAVAFLGGFYTMVLLLAIVSCIALIEFARITGLGGLDPAAVRMSLLIALAHYGIVLTGHLPAYTIFVPIAGIVLLACLPLLRDNPSDYLRSTAGLFWGTVLLVYGLSHTLYPLMHPRFANAPAGVLGWCLYLIVLTETNDIAQALVGRRFGAHGRHRIAPVVSPNKTWEGFLGGMAITVALAVLLAPWLTTLHRLPVFGSGPWFVTPAIAGLLVAVTGFLGDVNLSAVKRDVGVKDSSRLLPGMGGCLDRIDSLTFAAPAFVYYVLWISS